MKNFKNNGYVMYDESDINYREYCIKAISQYLENQIRTLNNAWKLIRVETPVIIPECAVSQEYDKKDYFSIDGEIKEPRSSLRPETTWGSYSMLTELLDTHTQKLPLCVWQAGKSFRNEQDKTFRNLRFKEFYQLEFQFAYSNDSKADYYTNLLEYTRFILSYIMRKYCEIEESDRLPSYSLKTNDVICRETEIASVSLRQDFIQHPVVEVAIGLDRVLYHGKNYEMLIGSCLDS